MVAVKVYVTTVVSTKNDMLFLEAKGRVVFVFREFLWVESSGMFGRWSGGGVACEGVLGWVRMFGFIVCCELGLVWEHGTEVSIFDFISAT